VITTCAFRRLSAHRSLVMELCAVLFLVTFRLLAGAPDPAKVPGGDPTPHEALQDELLRMGGVVPLNVES